MPLKHYIILILVCICVFIASELKLIPSFVYWAVGGILFAAVAFILFDMLFHNNGHKKFKL